MQRVCSSPCWRRSPLPETLFLRRSRRKATDQAKTDSSTTKNTEKKNADVAPAQKKNPGWLPSRKERMSAAFPLRKKRGTPKHCQRSFAMVARAQRECFSKAHFSRKMTSPWPTSWSFNHKRYL